MNTKKKLQIWGWLLLCVSVLVMLATVIKIHYTDVFEWIELLVLVLSILTMIYGFTLIHTVKYAEEDEVSN